MLVADQGKAIETPKQRPPVQATGKTIARWLEEKGIQAGELKGRKTERVAEARKALRQVLAKRGLSLSPEQEARIEARADLTDLEHWHDHAITADEALRWFGRSCSLLASP